MQMVVEGETSTKMTVDSEVPQETVLGTFLFLCHINDLLCPVTSQVRLFADDCLLYRTIRTQADHISLQNDLSELEKWAERWGTRFKTKKCYIMSINNRSSHFCSVNNHIIHQAEENPYLGLTLTENLKWSSHITKIIKKANSTMGFLRRNLKNCPPESRKMAYISLVRSSLEYGSIIWDPYLLQDTDKLERVQRQAARFITGDYRSREEGSVTKMLEILDLQSLENRRSASKLVFFYKVVEGLVLAVSPEEFLKSVKQKRIIKTKKFRDYKSFNIIERQLINHDRGSGWGLLIRE